jgi:hypothetical protein
VEQDGEPGQGLVLGGADSDPGLLDVEFGLVLTTTHIVNPVPRICIFGLKCIFIWPVVDSLSYPADDDITHAGA